MYFNKRTLTVIMAFICILCLSCKKPCLSNSPYEETDALSKLKLTISTFKTEYVLREPIKAKIILRNENDYSVIVKGVNIPEAYSYAMLQFYILRAGEKDWVIFEPFGRGDVSGEVPNSFTLIPGEDGTRELLFHVQNWRKSGTYKLKAVLKDHRGEAIEAICEYFGLGPAYDEKGVALLERFLKEFPNSTYSPYVKYRAGLSYLKGFKLLDEKGKSIGQISPDYQEATEYLYSVVHSGKEFQYLYEAMIDLARCYGEMKDWVNAYHYVDEVKRLCKEKALLNRAKETRGVIYRAEKREKRRQELEKNKEQGE